VQLDSETILGIKTSLTQTEESHHRLLEITSQTNPKQPIETEAHELGHHLMKKKKKKETDKETDSALQFDGRFLSWCFVSFVLYFLELCIFLA
jgi:hypothetical protein